VLYERVTGRKAFDGEDVRNARRGDPDTPALGRSARSHSPAAAALFRERSDTPADTFVYLSGEVPRRTTTARSGAVTRVDLTLSRTTATGYQSSWRLGGLGVSFSISAIPHRASAHRTSVRSVQPLVALIRVTSVLTISSTARERLS